MSTSPPPRTPSAGLRVRRAQRIADVSRDSWDFVGCGGSAGLAHDALQVVEESRLNDLVPHYLLFEAAASGEAVARANLYSVDFDLATTDKRLSRAQRAAIKSWFPRFMTFRFLECGLFTMIGMGVQWRRERSPEDVLPLLIAEMDEIARQDGAEFLMLRDVPWEWYERFSKVLIPAGFRPVLGFANARIDVAWSSLDAMLATMSHKRRQQCKTALQFAGRFQIECERLTDFAAHAPDLARLWRNVASRAPDYSREQLSESFFRKSSEILGERGELFLFRHRGTPVAFGYCLIGDDDYVCLGWGVDYEFEHYRQANLYRAVVLLGIESAIRHGKRRVELGITNYPVKRALGASVQPLVYFVRHRDQPRYTNTLTRLMAFNIQQPQVPPEDAAFAVAVEERIKLDQDDLPPGDVFRKVGRQYKFTSLELGGIYGFYPEFKTAQRSSIEFGDRRDVVLLGTNSYLGLATHPEVSDAAKQAIDAYGTGCSGSPLLNGTLDIHNRLECELANFLQKEAVVLCSTGYQTNLAALTALCDADDLIVLDACCHRSLFDAARLSGADFVAYRHRDMDHLRRVLDRNRSRPKLIVTDSVFSMEGTVAHLKAICALAREFGARMYVDESHAIGVIGPDGQGMCAQQGVLHQVDLVMGTFSKSLAAVGGFVAGSRRTIEHIKHHGAGHIFSASLPPPAVASIRAALRITRAEPERRSAVQERAAYMAMRLREIGFDVTHEGTPIVPIALGSFPFALASYRWLMNMGVYVNPVGPPAVPEERSGFRTSYMATHRWEDLERALGVFRALRDYMVK